MIYPFRVINIQPAQLGQYTLTIEVSKVLRYEPSIDPATQYRTPIIEFQQSFHTVEATTEEEALNKVAQHVASS